MRILNLNRENTYKYTGEKNQEQSGVEECEILDPFCIREELKQQRVDADGASVMLEGRQERRQFRIQTNMSLLVQEGML